MLLKGFCNIIFYRHFAFFYFRHIVLLYNTVGHFHISETFQIPYLNVSILHSNVSKMYLKLLCAVCVIHYER